MIKRHYIARIQDADNTDIREHSPDNIARFSADNPRWMRRRILNRWHRNPIVQDSLDGLPYNGKVPDPILIRLINYGVNDASHSRPLPGNHNTRGQELPRLIS